MAMKITAKGQTRGTATSQLTTEQIMALTRE
jgi:hypothetical protein